MRRHLAYAAALTGLGFLTGTGLGHLLHSWHAHGWM